jgi:hypothetical protein
MADTLNVTKQGKGKEMLADLKKKVDELLQQRSRLVEEEGPESVAVVELNVRLGEIVEFCEKNSIEGISRQEILPRLEQANVPLNKKTDLLRAQYREKYWRQIEERIANEARIEAEKRLPLELEKARRQRRREAIMARCREEGLKDLHLDEQEDPASCEVVYRGPVFRLINLALHSDTALEPESRLLCGLDDDGQPGAEIVFDDQISREQEKQRKKKFSFNPFLLSTYLFGGHPACFHELTDLKKDFMAGLRHDPSSDSFTVKAIDPSITIKRLGSDSFAPFMQSSYPLEEGETVRLEHYHLQVERQHGYSAGALEEEARSHLEEMMEIIFDTARTTGAQDREAYLNIGRVLACNLPADRKKNLRTFLARVYAKNLRKKWNEVRAWQEDKMLPDAREFTPLMMTLDVLEEGRRYFDFELPFTSEELAAEARRRVASYGRAFAELQQPESSDNAWMLVEAARLAEMGLLERNVLEKAAPALSLAVIDRVVEVRALVDKLCGNEAEDQLMLIIKLVKTARGLKMSDIYGQDEIIIRNQNIDLKLTPALSVVADQAGMESYLAQLARKIARNAWHKLSQKRTAEERKNELSLIKALIDLGKVRPIHLVDFDGQGDPLVRERQIEQQLLDLESGIATSLRREDLERQEKERSRLLAATALGEEYGARQKLLERAMEAVEILHQWKNQPDGPEKLFELRKCAPVFTDRAVTAVVGGCLEQVVTEPLERQLKDYEGRVTRVLLNPGPLQRGWPEIAQEWQQEIEKLVVLAREKVLCGEQSMLWFFLLQATVEGWPGKAENFEKERKRLERAVEKEQFQLLRQAVLYDNPAVAAEMWPEWLEKEDFRLYEKMVDGVRLKIGQRFMSDLLIKIVEGEQCDRHREFARKLLMEVPSLRYSLSVPEYDLLL